MGLHFDIMVKNKFVRWLVKNRLASKNCKKILCHCEATRQSFFKYLECEKFKHKLEVLYPSSHLVDFKVEKSNKIRFLFVSSLFKHKGGDFVLEAFRKIHEKYPKTELLIRADVPAETRKRYGDEGIIFEDYSGKNILPREEFIKNVFSRGDVFIYTTFCDSLGYSLFDALISKMPIIGTNLFAVPEIVLDGKNGFVLDIPGYNREKWVQEHHIDKMTSEDKKKFVNLLTKSMENFIKNPSLIKKMGREGYRRISNGDLSISERNKKLKEVYLGALK